MLTAFLNPVLRVCFFFFNDTATTEIYTLSLHDALPISPVAYQVRAKAGPDPDRGLWLSAAELRVYRDRDRESAARNLDGVTRCGARCAPESGETARRGRSGKPCLRRQ